MVNLHVWGVQHIYIYVHLWLVSILQSILKMLCFFCFSSVFFFSDVVCWKTSLRMSHGQWQRPHLIGLAQAYLNTKPLLIHSFISSISQVHIHCPARSSFCNICPGKHSNALLSSRLFWLSAAGIAVDRHETHSNIIYWNGPFFLSSPNVTDKFHDFSYLSAINKNIVRGHTLKRRRLAFKPVSFWSVRFWHGKKVSSQMQCNIHERDKFHSVSNESNVNINKQHYPHA